jgi:zinc protease
MKLLKITLVAALLVVVGCKDASQTTDQEFSVAFEQFELDNGLNVIMHVDRSDPVVAVALTSHVGSAREKEGRTGFAHLFEHLLFLESENLGKGGLDEMSGRIGGSGANGSTSRDRTNYFQTVPNDALEKMIWAEADKLGWFINTVTEPVLAKEKQVVKNEKRQRVDNAPYGHNFAVIDQNLYPKGHPYSWQVIGSLEDLQNATLQDVKDFYNRWYVPNNVTLTIAGDFNVEQAKEWVKKYFSEIERGEDIPKLEKQPVVLTETKKLYYEDNFARLPQLTLAWPGVYQYHEDSYALSVLLQYLSQGKKAPFTKILVEDKQLTSSVGAFSRTSELAGEIMVQTRAYPGKDLNEVYSAINEAFTSFETNGISQEDLNRIKAGQETRFYNGLSSVLGKGFQLAQYQIFTGDPGFINQDIKNILAVTADDVMRVYKKYIKDKHFVATSFVPKGQTHLALEDSKLANVVEEKIIDGAEETFDASVAATYEKTPSSFDRSVEPPYGPTPEIKVPNVWKTELSNGIKVFGITNTEVPLVQFELEIKSGLLLEQPNKIGASNLVATLLTKGTQNKTPEELESAIESLGASINAFATDQTIVISGNTLAKNYQATMQLVEEMLLQPRWDEKEFELAKQSTLSSIIQQKANPNSIAANAFAKLLYGEGHPLSHNNLGTEATVNAITLNDLKAYYQSSMSPSYSNFHAVGDITQEEVVTSLQSINEGWAAKEINFPEVTMPALAETAKVYFYDVPGAKQSVLRFGYPALKATHPDYYKATVMNYRLGGGGFSSILTQQLREGKGYTYGIRSSFNGNSLAGFFTISSGVRSNVTYESTALVKEILENYATNFNETDLAATKGYMVKSSARSFETLAAKLGMLGNISNYDYPVDYAKQRIATVENMTVEDVKTLAERYIHPDKMIYVIVGDAATQLDKLEQLGLGKPELLNK